MENAFYFTLKALFFSRQWNFCLDFQFMQKSDLIRKIRLISKLLTSQPGKQTIAIQILTNILRSKGNQRRKLGQLMEYRTTNIFLKKLYAKCGGKTSPRHLFEKSKLSIYLDQQSKLLYSAFIVCQAEGYRITRFFYRKILYKKMRLKNQKTLRKCSENLQSQMPKLKF